MYSNSRPIGPPRVDQDPASQSLTQTDIKPLEEAFVSPGDALPQIPQLRVVLDSPITAPSSVLSLERSDSPVVSPESSASLAHSITTGGAKPQFELVESDNLTQSPVSEVEKKTQGSATSEDTSSETATSPVSLEGKVSLDENKSPVSTHQFPIAIEPPLQTGSHPSFSTMPIPYPQGMEDKEYPLLSCQWVMHVLKDNVLALPDFNSIQDRWRRITTGLTWGLKSIGSGYGAYFVATNFDSMLKATFQANGWEEPTASETGMALGASLAAIVTLCQAQQALIDQLTPFKYKVSKITTKIWEDANCMRGEIKFILESIQKFSKKVSKDFMDANQKINKLETEITKLREELQTLKEQHSEQAKLLSTVCEGLGLRAAAPAMAAPTTGSVCLSGLYSGRSLSSPTRAGAGATDVIGSELSSSPSTTYAGVVK